MNGVGSPFEVDQELISSATSGEDIIGALARRGCLDLTTHIDSAACGSLPLAGGGFCDVYQGSTNRGDKIAIKSLRLCDKPGKDNEKVKILKRAARELYHWSKLKHPNILPLMGLAMFRGHLSMVSEWMEHGSLMAYISVNTGMDRIGLCLGICSGLSHIHANDMVHGDLKVANVMVSRDGTAMIADFGNSQLKDLTLKFTNTTSSSLSVRWTAPELLDGDDDPQVTKELDVYAYGMTVLETLTGKVPFEEFGERKVLTMVALKHQTPARPAVGVSDEIWDILRRCWAWKQAERPSITIVERLMGDAHTQARVKGKGPDSTGNSQMTELVNPGPVEIHLEQVRIGKSESLATTVQQPAPEEAHSGTLENMYHPAAAHFEQGRLAEAESLWVRVVAAWKEILGPHHPNTLQVVYCLFFTYLNQGRLAEAEPLGVEVVAARKRVLGVDHSDTLQSAHCLAVTYQRPGRLVEGEALRAEVVAARKRVLGAENPDTLWSIHNLAIVYRRRGYLAKAESLAAEVLAARKRTLGEHHPDTINGTLSLAGIYQAQNRQLESQLLLNQANNFKMAAK